MGGKPEGLPFQASSQPQRGSSGVDVMPPGYLHTRPEGWASAPPAPDSQPLGKGCLGVTNAPRPLQPSEPVCQAGSGRPRDVLWKRASEMGNGSSVRELWGCERERPLAMVLQL